MDAPRGLTPRRSALGQGDARAGVAVQQAVQAPVHVRGHRGGPGGRRARCRGPRGIRRRSRLGRIGAVDLGAARPRRRGTRRWVPRRRGTLPARADGQRSDRALGGVRKVTRGRRAARRSPFGRVGIRTR